MIIKLWKCGYKSDLERLLLAYRIYFAFDAIHFTICHVTCYIYEQAQEAVCLDSHPMLSRCSHQGMSVKFGKCPWPTGTTGLGGGDAGGLDWRRQRRARKVFPFMLLFFNEYANLNPLCEISEVMGIIGIISLLIFLIEKNTPISDKGNVLPTDKGYCFSGA